MLGRPIELVSDRGVFSHTHLDAGTEVLLRHAPPPPEQGDLLDLGCGYGPVAVYLALHSPRARVWAVDVNTRAVALTRENADRLGLPNVRASSPDEVGATGFAAIYSNPPVRVGKGVMRELLLAWLPRLRPGARAYWVVKKSLGADALAQFLTERGYNTVRLRSKRGYRLLESRR